VLCDDAEDNIATAITFVLQQILVPFLSMLACAAVAAVFESFGGRTAQAPIV